MPKVMILDHILSDVIKLERILKPAGYEVCSLTGPYGILAKFDFEKPDILLFNPDMPNADTDALLSTLVQSNDLQQMIIILICSGDAVAIEQYCREMKLHGYFMTENGFDGILPYLAQFYGE
ncbi:MAG: hypothetical protein IJ268_09875 [Proteobacteria bacterium]|nr:hypothetical protein [Pseudomonadota bacterium]MBQ9244339.1 hypothetical protein [Pseudomonadota bacterium]